MSDDDDIIIGKKKTLHQQVGELRSGLIDAVEHKILTTEQAEEFNNYLCDLGNAIHESDSDA